MRATSSKEQVRVHRAFEASFVMGLSDRIDMKIS